MLDLLHFISLAANRVAKYMEKYPMNKIVIFLAGVIFGTLITVSCGYFYYQKAVDAMILFTDSHYSQRVQWGLRYKELLDDKNYQVLDELLKSDIKIFSEAMIYSAISEKREPSAFVAGILNQVAEAGIDVDPDAVQKNLDLIGI